MFNSVRLSSTYVYPAKIFIRVDFPEPDGPIMAVNSPAQNSPFTLSKIVLFPGTKKKLD